ncbi:MAG TPA: PPC domain-containing protein [Myxococcales bacterium]
MKRFKLLFALCAALGGLGGCNQATSASRAADEANDALTTTAPRLQIDSPVSALPGGQFEVDVSFRDASGNLLKGANPVTVALGKNPGASAFSGTRTLMPVNGVARFSDLGLDKPAQGYTVVATSVGSTSATSLPINVTWSEDALTVSGKQQNATLATAQAISPNVPMFGNLDAGVQYYRFHAINGQLLSATSFANRLAADDWDTSLRLRVIAPDGVTEIARSSAMSATAKGIDSGILALRIPADGDYFLACDSDIGGFASGRYALLVALSSTVGTVVQTETEPWGVTGVNDSMATAQPLQQGLLFGHFDTPASNASASDFYKIVVSSPSRVRIDLVAARNGAAYGDGLWNARLDLIDSSGAVLWSNDDSYGKDPVVDYIVTKAGTYFVRVGRSETPTNTAASPYLLTYVSAAYSPVAEGLKNSGPSAATRIAYGAEVSGNFLAAGDHFFSFAGTAGDGLRLTVEGKQLLQNATLTLNPQSGADAVLLAGDGVTPLPAGTSFGTASESKLNLRQTILPTTGTYYVRVRSNAAGRFGLRLDRLATSSREIEPNNTAATGTKVPASGFVSGVISSAGDVDHFKVHALAGQLVTVAAFAAPGGGSGNALADFGSALMPTLQLRDPAGNLLSTSSADRQGNVNFAETNQRPEEMLELAFRAPATADYDLAVSDADGLGGPAYFYGLQVRANQ